MIGRNVHIRASMTIPAIMPATEVATHMITIVCNENCIKIINAQNFRKLLCNLLSVAAH